MMELSVVHPLYAYLPQDRRHAQGHLEAFPDHAQGAVLFADISGFTQLTEDLTQRLGPHRGAEELLRHLNAVYDTLIAMVDNYQGSVISFSGDAITCWFDEAHTQAVARAVACALAMQTAMAPFTTLAPTLENTLALKVAVAAGAVRRFLVGDPRIQRMDVLAGSTLARMAIAEGLATEGEIVLDAATVAALGEAVSVAGWRTASPTGEQFALLAGLSLAVAPHPWEATPLMPWPEAELRAWVLAPIYARLQLGQGEFLTELRPAVTLFLRFQGIDYDHDPEAASKLDRYICWVQHVVADYDGSVLQPTIGDKGSYVQIIFGAPTAHEDDPHRAVATALALRALPPELGFLEPVQIGMSAGTMRTGAYGSRSRRTYGVLGDEVNLAARLMTNALPGQVLASAAVQSITASAFLWRALPPLQVKGKSAPVALWELLHPQQAQQASPEATKANLALVGRGPELALIRERLHRARMGQGQLVGVSGAPGIGKSRLVAETTRIAQAQGFAVFYGSCHSYTQTPYFVWQSIWRACFQLDPELPLDQQQQQLEAQLAALDPALVPRLPLLAPIVDLPLPDNSLTSAFDAPLRKASREALLLDCLKGWAGTSQGMLFVLEDCHWIDPLSQDLLHAISRLIPTLPLVVILAYRPPQAPAPPLWEPAPHTTEISLTELSPAETARLVHATVAQIHHTASGPVGLPQRLPPTLMDAILQRAQGVPFFVQELLHYLAQRALDWEGATPPTTLDWPTSLHSLVLSRVDQLVERQRIVIKVASIIGRAFRARWVLGTYPDLGDPDILSADLAALTQVDLITPNPLPSDPEYLFTHIVTQEVLYASLPHAMRTTLHEAFAHYLESEPNERSSATLDRLAYHYGLSANLPKKQEYLWRAGQAAQQAYANQAAQDYYNQLLPLLEAPEPLVQTHMALGDVLSIVGQRSDAAHHYHAALAVAEGFAEAAWAQLMLVRLKSALGNLMVAMGTIEEGQGWLHQARDQAETLPPTPAVQEALNHVLVRLGNSYWSQRDYKSAEVWLESALSMARQHRRDHIEASALINLSLVVSDQGDYVKGRDLLLESLALCRRQGDKPGIARCLNNLGILARDQGDYAEAQALYEKSLALRREIGDRTTIANTLNNLGILAKNQGDYPRAKALYTESLAIRHQIGDQSGVALSLHNLGNIAKSQGDFGVAQTHLLESLARFQALNDRWGMALAVYNLGVVAFLQEDYPKAQELHERGLHAFQEIGHQITFPNCLYNLGYIALMQGHNAQAHSQLIEGLRLAHQQGVKQGMIPCLIGIAGLMVRTAEGRQDHLGVGARLLASGQALLSALGVVMEPETQVIFRQTLALLRSQMDERAWQQVWVEGGQMTLDEAVGMALASAPLA